MGIVIAGSIFLGRLAIFFEIFDEDVNDGEIFCNIFYI
jgi:hypothetical protein